MSVISSFFRSVRNSSPQNTNIPGHPMLNEIHQNLNNFFASRTQIGKKQVLMRWYKTSLELQNLTNKVAKDLTGDFHFENVNPSTSGRNKILTANKFATEVQYKRQKYSQNIDKLVTGERFTWLGFLKDKQIKDAISKSIGNRPFMEKKTLKNLEKETFLELKKMQGMVEFDGIDEDLLRPRKIRTIASSSMEVKFNQNEILGYVQDVGGKKEPFTTKEIIRGTLADVDGKVSGFTSVESAIVQLELLRFMWQNMMSIHKNGGHMDKMFILEDGQVNSPAYERIREQLQKYKLVENKHGNMLFTGKVKIEDLTQLDKMQFMDMGLYITSLLAMMWEIPKSSLPMIVGSTNTKDDSGGNSEKGYWSNIEFEQERDAEIDNLQLWIPHFGVRLVYERNYVQKDVQEETAKQLRFNNVKTIDETVRANKKRIKFEDRAKMLGLDKEIFEDIPEEELMQEVQGDGITGTGKQMSNNEVNDSQDKANMNKKKKIESDAAIVSGGMKPTGTGKEWDKATEMEYKQIIGSDDEVLPLADFVKIYNEDRASNPGSSPRLFRRENPNFITFKFKSTDFVYRTIIDKEKEEDNRVLLMNLGGNIYNL